MLKKRFFKTVDECEVTFRVEPEEASSVALVIDSNEWAPIPMKQLKSGPFQTKLRLPLNSTFQFRYLVDGEQWANDEAADAYVRNQYGGDNCIVETTRNGT